MVLFLLRKVLKIFRDRKKLRFYYFKKKREKTAGLQVADEISEFYFEISVFSSLIFGGKNFFISYKI